MGNGTYMGYAINTYNRITQLVYRKNATSNNAIRATHQGQGGFEGKDGTNGTNEDKRTTVSTSNNEAIESEVAIKNTSLVGCPKGITVSALDEWTRNHEITREANELLQRVTNTHNMSQMDSAALRSTNELHNYSIMYQFKCQAQDSTYVHSKNLIILGDGTFSLQFSCPAVTTDTG